MVMQKEMETRRQPLYVLGERPAGLQRELEIRRGLVGTNPARREKLMDEGMWEKWKSGKRGNCRELQRQMEWKASQWGGDTRLWHSGRDRRYMDHGEWCWWGCTS